MSIDFNKYNPLKKPPLMDWKDSVSVVALSDLLKAIGKKHSISLAIDNGTPCLLIDPGFTKKNGTPERMDMIEQCSALLVDAADDLRELVSAGKLTLPESPHRRIM